MKRIRFDDGLELWGLNPSDARVLHRQIFVERSYEKAGLRLPAGARVFDVGANIGLFSTWLTTLYPGVELFCFEPLPEVFEALRRNLGPRSQLFCCGLSDQRGAAQFVYDPALSSMSTMQPGTLTRSRQHAAASAWGRATLELLTRANAISRPLASALKAAPALTMAALALRHRLASKRVTCPLRTLSDVIAEHRVDRIDLLKVDVEGAEELVLRGLADADWPKVQQVIIEVSDTDGRVKRVEQTLRERGFTVTTAQDDDALLRLLGLFNVYATRSA